MNIRIVLDQWKPFWVYWLIITTLCFVVGGVCSLLPILWFGVIFLLPYVFFVLMLGAFLVGHGVQKNLKLQSRMKKIGVATICSALVMSLFPITLWGYGLVQYGRIIKLTSLILIEKDMIYVFYIVVFLHFLAFWVGEEIEKA